MSKLQLINQALALTGNNPIQAGDDSTVEWMTADLHYERILRSELENHHFAFAKRSAKLESRVEPDFGFPLAFRLPGACISVRKIFFPYDDSNCYPGWLPGEEARVYPMDDWEQSDGTLYVNDLEFCRYDRQPGDPVWIEYTGRDRVEEKWSSNFESGLQYKLASVFSRALNEEEGIASTYDQEAESYFHKARVRSDRKDNSVKLSNVGRLQRARMGYNHGGYGRRHW